MFEVKKFTKSQDSRELKFDENDQANSYFPLHIAIKKKSKVKTPNFIYLIKIELRATEELQRESNILAALSMKKEA